MKGLVKVSIGVIAALLATGAMAQPDAAGGI